MKRMFLIILAVLFLMPKMAISEEKIKIDLFVRSRCVLSNLAEQSLMSSREIFKGLLDINIYYIADYKYGDFKGLYGKKEIDEDIRQLVMQKYYPNEFWKYLQLRNTDIRNLDNWYGVLFVLGIDKERFEKLVNDEGKNLLLDNVMESRNRNIKVSPTLYIDDQYYEGRFDVASLMVSLCKKTKKVIRPCKALPECFSDQDCLVPGKDGKCSNSGRPDAKCIVSDLEETTARLISSKKIEKNERYQDLLNNITRRYRSLSVKEVSVEDKKILKLVESLGIQGLPVLIFDNKIESVEEYKKDIKSEILKKIGDYYILSNHILPERFFYTREPKKDHMRVFLMSECPFGISIVNQLIEKKRKKTIDFEIDFNYIIRKDKSGEFTSLHGKNELEEDLRQIIINKYYPDKFFDYLICRNKDIHKNDWEVCAAKIKIDKDVVVKKVKEERDSILSRELTLKTELGVHASPTVLWENQYKITDLEELKKIKGLGDLKKTRGSCK